jgi:simple sugar transport system permease protein
MSESTRSALDRARDGLAERLDGLSGRQTAGLVAGAVVVVAFVAAGLARPESLAGELLDIATSESAFGAALRLSVPIALAALGGIFAEKSGVINIGLEGLLIIAAFGAIWGTDVTGSILAGFWLGVLASTLLAGLFAVVCIEFRADQIIAGLAVWLIALGLAPFASQVVYGGPNTDSVGTVPTLPEVLWFLPTAEQIPTSFGVPVLGGLLGFVLDVLLEASLSVYLMVLMVGVSWYLLNRTTFGRWVRASGENPSALDTAGVNVSRVRYAAVLLSGVFAGMGGSALSLGLGQFTGNGPTMVNGKGFIAIVAYLFGNYNPVGAFLSTFLFAGLDALQLTLQTRGTGIPDSLVRIVPFVTVIVVLALVGRTRIPEAAGEHYESGEE